MNTQPLHNSSEKQNRYFLAVDIGGTNLRICGCRLETAQGEVHRLWKETDVSGDLPKLRNTLIQAVEKLLVSEKVVRITIAVIGVPGKVSKDRRSSALTFLDPSGFIDIAKWLEPVGAEQVLLLNDLECGTYGIQTTPLSRLLVLSGNKLTQIPDSYLLGMPGTGLGVGYWKQGAPQATEGGHGLVVCNPDDPMESHLWRELYRMNPSALPVYDDLACGPGLATLAKILSIMPVSTPYHKPDLSSISDAELPEMLSQWASESDNPSENSDFACAVFRYFGTFLGRALQLPLLTTLPETLFLAGPIVQASISHFRDQFLQAIHTHRYHEEWLESLPIAVVDHPELNLDGAVEAAKQVILSKEIRNSP